MFQDSKGFIWIGTGEGVSVFDGHSFLNYTTQDGLSFNYIISISESPDGKRVWLGTGDGATKYENGRWTSYHTADSIQLAENEIVVDSNGTAWSFSSHGLFRFDGEKFHRYPSAKKLTYTSSPVIDRDGTLWFVSVDTLYYRSRNEFEVKQFLNPNFIHDSLLSVNVDKRGDVWVTNQKSLPSLYVISRGKLKHALPLSLKIGNALDDEKGRMIFQSAKGIISLSIENPSEFTMSIIDNTWGLKDNAVNPGLVDSEGNLWFYGGNFGLAVLTERNVVNIPAQITSYPINNNVSAIDSRGHIWVATGEELIEVWKSGNNTWELYSHSEVHKVVGKNPAAVTFDVDGFMYCKSWESDCGKFRVSFKEGERSVLHSERVIRRGIDFPDAGLVCIFVDRKNRLWGSIHAVGVAVFDMQNKPTMLRLYKESDGIPGESIRSIFEDREGNIWLGGFSQGLTKISNPLTSSEKLQRITIEDGLPEERIRAMTELPDGSLLVGFRYSGMVKITEGKYLPLTKSDGLASNALWCLACDSSGVVVAGTDNGGQILNSFNNVSPNKYIYASGEHIASCGISGNGIVWFVSSSGLTIIDNVDFERRSPPPPIYIQSVRMNNMIVDASSKSEFTHDQNHFTIQFTGVHFKEPQSLKYEYRLLPSEQLWSPSIFHSTVTFAQLTPGTYTFEVRAITGEELRSTVPSTFTFTIASPIWKRWWFIFSSNVVVIGLLWLAYRYRTNQLLEIERLRTRISADLHDEIASNLSSIAMFSKIIEEETHTTTTLQSHHQSLLNRIASLSQESVQSIRDIIWAIDPKTETLESLLNRLRDFTFALCRVKKIQVIFQSPREGEISNDDLAPEVRKNVWLIAKEAIHNSVQHSQCSTIRISYKVDATILTLRIEDDGVGIDEKKSSKGKGLATMRSRAKQLNGNLEIGRNEKGGTSVVANVKIVGRDLSRPWTK